MAKTPERPVRLGVQIQPQHAAYPQIRETLRRVEEAGVDVVTTRDHVFPLTGEPDGYDFGEIEVSVAGGALDGPGPGQAAQDLYAEGAWLVTVTTGGPDHPLDQLDAWLAWRDERNG